MTNKKEATQNPTTATVQNLDMVLDLELPLTVRLGTAALNVGDALGLDSGSVVELDRAADAPIEMFANGRLVAKGELVVLDGSFAVRVLEVQSQADRLRSLGRS